jgi:23S rRNA (guanosine2251-2'-O)-methyltransferase
VPRGRGARLSPGEEVVAGRRAALEAVRAGLARAVLLDARARATPGLRSLEEAARRAGVELQRAPRSELDRLAEDHRGVVAVLAGGAPTLAERDLATLALADDALAVVLDGIEDPQNLGAAARVAEVAGAALLVTRRRRAAPVSAAAIRASAGALLHLPHLRAANVARAIERLQAVGFTVVGLAGEADRTVYDEPAPPGRLAIVVGAEGAGLSRLVRERCDLLVSLPMRGKVGSLNAATALAAALYAYALPRSG